MPRDDSVSAGREAAKRGDAVAASVAGVVLCGGESRRMGRPKALLPFGTRTLLQHVVQTVASAVDRVVVVAAANQSLPALPQSVVVLRDVVPARGPLGGLKTAFGYLHGRVRRAFVCGCDMPLLRPQLIAFLLREARATDAQIVIPEHEGRLHPLCAVYDVSAVAAHADELVRCGRLRPVYLTDLCRTLRIASERLREVDPELDSFRNANTPEAYAAVLRRAAELGLLPGNT